MAGGDRAGKDERPGEPLADLWTSAKGDSRPAWPPAPAATAITPSAPFCTALRANRSLMMSWSAMPPQPCTPWFTSSIAPSEVITIGTFHFAQVAMSASSRVLERWTIWLTAKGAAGRSGFARVQAASSSVMRCSHSSSSA
jgi:hypothetical protein